MADVEDNMYFITGSLVTFLSVLIVVRFFQRILLKSHHKTEKKQKNTQVQKHANKDIRNKEDIIDETDIDDLLIKPDEIDEFIGLPPLIDDSLEEQDDSDFRCESLQGKLKQAKHKKIKEKMECDMTEEQIDDETQAKSNQLEAIFKLMEKNKDTFGIEDMNKVTDQLKLYAIN